MCIRDRFKGENSTTPGGAVKESEAIFICVGRDEDLREVMEGESGILHNAKTFIFILNSIKH